MLRLSAIVTALLVGGGLLSAPGAVAAMPQAPPVTPIAWHACSDPELAYLDLQCGSLQVPLDHAAPAGAKLTLALTRKVHTSSTYRGVMLTNPGGPGGSGLSLASIGDYVPGGAGAAYDWIGFDPRGVGASSPSLHCTQRYFTYDRPSYVPRATWIYRSWLARARNYSTACANTAAKRAILPHLTTLDSVNDMDLIRQALGREKLSFYGFSYGTYLGQVYATRFPTRVDRFVLDGVVDARRVWYSANFDQDRAFDANMDVYWRYLAAHPGTFHLGKRWKAIKRGYYHQLKVLDRHAAAGGRLGPDELGDVMLEAGYYVYGWVELGKAYSALVRQHRGGALLARYRDSNVGDDNGFAVYNAVQCSDVPWPGWTRTRQDSWAVHRRAPFSTWGNTWFNAPCMTWKAPRHQKLSVTGNAVNAKMLLISETRDAATPFSGALTARRQFPSASLVAGVGGTTHASSLSGVSCVDNAVAAYLNTGVVPKRQPGNRADRSCPRVLPPQPSVNGRATTTSTDQMSPLLRHDLLAAQRYTLH